MWFKYPYTNYSELNLDWFLSQFKVIFDGWTEQKADYEQFKNDMTEEFNTLSGKFDDLEDAVEGLQQFVENYFDNLDVQQEINNKLDALVADGTLSTLLAPLVEANIGDAVAAQIGDTVADQIGPVVGTQLPGVVSDQIDGAVATPAATATTAWLNDNVDPVGSAVVVDSSLTISGAAADAKVTGDYLTELDDVYNKTTHRSRNLLDINNIETGCFYWINGYNANAGYNTSNKLYVSEGDVIRLQYGNETVHQGRQYGILRFVTAYASDDTLVDYDRDNTSYTVPSGVSYLLISISSGVLDNINHCVMLDDPDGTLEDYIPYYDPYVERILKAANNNVPFIKSVIDERIGETTYHKNGLSITFDMNGDNHLISDDVQDLFNYSIEFRGKVLTFDGVRIAHGYNQNYGGYINITPTTFEYYLGTEASPRISEPHALTITDYLAVRLDAKPGYKADVTIFTNGGIYMRNNITWDVRRGKIGAYDLGSSTIEDCTLAYNCADWSKPIHMYGDSYFGVYTDKWTNYLTQAGFNDNLVNAYPGRASAEALTILKTVVKNSHPEKIVWCMGMNDGDTGAVNAAWKAAVEELMDICSARHIDLVLATIPSVATVDNTYKNAYVKASGYKYIDFASAVSLNSDSTWYTGMLSADGVHPSAEGAKALFNQAVGDLPDLMQ